MILVNKNGKLAFNSDDYPERSRSIAKRLAQNKWVPVTIASDQLDERKDEAPLAETTDQ